MASYQCSKCNHTFFRQEGICPKCGANLFLKEPVKKDVKRPGQDVPCKHCKLDISSDAFACKYCGEIQTRVVYQALGFSGFFGVIWIAALIFMLWTKSQGNETASFPIIAGCSLLNLASIGGFIFFFLKWRKALKARDQIRNGYRGNPPVELIKVVETVPNPIFYKPELAPLTTCKAFKMGICVVDGKTSGKCTWNPQDWNHCFVVEENRRFYRWFDEP